MNKSRRKKKKIHKVNLRTEANAPEREQAAYPPIDYVNQLRPSDYLYFLAGGRPSLYRFLFSVDSLSLWIILVGYLSVLTFRVPDLQVLPSYVRTIIGSALIASATNRSISFLILVINRKKIRTDPRYLLRFIAATFLSNLLSATVFVVGCLYYFGVVDFVAVLLQKIWPYLSDKVSYAVSTVLNWVASGIIGNYAFQFIKKRFEKREEPSNGAQKKVRSTRT
jgi:hypothetical protein